MYVYRCPICKKDVKQPIAPSCPPWCSGPDRTHHKEMQFVEELSTNTPNYLLKKKEKKS